MSRHREPRPRHAYWQIRRHLTHLLDSFRYWLYEQHRELQDIAAELKRRTK